MGKPKKTIITLTPRQVLENRLAELALAVRDRDGIVINHSSDALDAVQHASERELAIRNLDRETRELRNVQAALRRIDEGTYGTCLDCREDINPKRLKALPSASLCVTCQQKADSAINDYADSAQEAFA